MKIKIVKNGINGEGIGYINKKPVFVRNTLRNEVVDVNITEENDRYCKGELVRVFKSNGLRVESECIYQKKCGGCALMNAKYDYQLVIKKELLRETLQKYCGYKGDIEDVNKSDKDLFYRNKCSLPFSVNGQGDLANCLYQPNSNIPLTFDKCIIHDNKLEKTRLAVLEVLNNHQCCIYEGKNKSGYRHLVLRGFKDGFQLVLVTGADKIQQDIIDDLMNIESIVSIYQGINTQKNPLEAVPERLKLLAGDEKIKLNISNLDLFLHPKAFFQLNRYTAEKMYNTVRGLVGKNPNLVVEAYCGVGAISLLCGSKSARVIGFDIDENAIEDAKFNAQKNDIDNVEFRCKDAKVGIKEIVENEQIDALVVDPPRRGLDNEFIETVNNSNISRIVYVSCNQATLAKNIKDLSNYKVDKVIPFDMFPQTEHVETVCLLSRKAPV